MSRQRFFHVRSLRLEPSMKNLLMLMICVCLGCATHVDTSTACPAVEMSAVALVPSDSTRPAVLDDGTTIPLARTPLVTNADITGAKASRTGGRWVLNLDV